MSLKLSSSEFEVGNKTIHGSLIKLDNAVIALIWEGPEPKLGTITITLPDRTSIQVIGERDEIISKMIGDVLAVKYGVLAMVSTNLPKEFIIGSELNLLLKKITGENSE
jgi:hypothetical protein